MRVSKKHFIYCVNVNQDQGSIARTGFYYNGSTIYFSKAPRHFATALERAEARKWHRTEVTKKTTPSTFTQYTVKKSL